MPGVRGVHFVLPGHAPYCHHYGHRRGVRVLRPTLAQPQQPPVTTFFPDAALAVARQDRASAPDLRFCVEMGMLIRSRIAKHKSVRSLMDEVSLHLLQTGVPNHVHRRRDTSENHREWTIIEDLTIPSQPADGRYGIKVVSPLVHFAPEHGGHWISAVDKVMSVLSYDFEASTNHHCGTHVHVVPARGFWTLTEAKRLARGALYFERCLDALVPPYRRRSVFAKSNRHNEYMGCRRGSECDEAIDRQTHTFAALAARMNWCSADSPTAEATGKLRNFMHAAYRWDFTTLDQNGHGTIAFRQPPGVTDTAQAIRWIMLVGCFARLNCMYKIRPDQKPRLEHLGQWVRHEARLAGFEKAYVEGLRRMFDRADTVNFARVAGRDAETISDDDAARLRWMDALDWNVGQQKFIELMRHRWGKGRA